jgi:pimeloyl-ACP methyl ester carboxylesterase
LEVPGARLCYEVLGSGPLLLIVGHPAGTEDFAMLAHELATDHRVVTYDPRGFGRSTIENPDQDADPKLLAEDAVRVLRAVGGAPAYVFGSSGGAVTGLALVADHPELVRTLLAHEPPVALLLPDSAVARAGVERVYETFTKSGILAAWREFAVFTKMDIPFEPPDAVPGPPPAEMIATSERFFRHGLLPIVLYSPDIPAILSTSARVEIGAGRASVGQFPRQTAEALATRLGRPLVEFPGGHGGFESDTKDFAKVLRRVFT